ncbi:PEP/pyruvate-binding domain-containing protein [Candidatus Leptofilum sp.]|uniref:PEP/pyruvate-binding domain-containing protein n=1 Tax=Candidatus Leptofilum sp. TaxID=3241576 RepID=UPI003B5C2DE7
MTEFLVPITQNGQISKIGGKGAQLRALMALEARVPKTFVVPWDVWTRGIVDETAVLTQLRAEFSQKLDLSKAYAVRSSANLEDGGEFSFAGQFATVLNVQGLNALVTAVQTVWASSKTDGVKTYLAQAGMADDVLKMAVILQEMVLPKVSGVAFSKNPMTGFDELIVEAVPGSGEGLVQDGTTPDRWVYKWGDWIAKPEQSQIGLSLVQTVVDETRRLAKLVKAPIDLEWVYDGTAVYIVQLREISTARQLNIYSNRISREVLPGIIKPLIWSVNVPLVNSAWIDIFTELIGSNKIEPNHLSKSFFYRAYFNMGVIGQVFEALGMPKETLELMMGIDEGGSERPSFRPSLKVMRHLPRMIRFGLSKSRFSRQIDAFLPKQWAAYRTFDQSRIPNLNETELLAEIDRLHQLTQTSAYFNIVTPLLMQLYSAMLKRRLENLGVAFETFDLKEDISEALAQYDPNVHLQRLHQLFMVQDTAVQQKLQQGQYEAAPQLVAKVNAFIEQFGHLSDSGNDFSAVPWRENESLVWQMVANFAQLSGSGEKKTTLASLPISGWQRFRLTRSVRRAANFLLYREAIGFLYTYGYGLFRLYFRALGGRFAKRGLLVQADDIFYLYLAEVRQLVAGKQIDGEPRQLVADRQADIEANREAVLPDIIFGDVQPPLETAVEIAQTLYGTPTSPGYYKGPLRVVSGLQDFEKLQAGDVLVIPFSDVGWTPLFTKAGAVIAESGGMLSHSSIVAREYQIPAVVSVTDACRLPDGAIVSVDGYKGEIWVHDGAVE